MSRMARVVAPGLPHHVTQRGNRRSDVFADEADCFAYRQCVLRYFSLHGLQIWAYCLMTNHVHFVAVPDSERSLGQAFRDAHTSYALSFNKRHGFTGHLWQGRFFSCPLDGEHLWAAVRYVERNPVRAGLTERAEAYPWSSAAAHCGLNSDPLLTGAFPPDGIIPDWREWLSTQPDEQIRQLRRCTSTGRPCGSKAFVDNQEVSLARPLHPQKPGPRRRLDDFETGRLWT